MKAYLLVINDTHADPGYKFFWQLDDAIEAARAAMAETSIYYRVEPTSWEHYETWPFSACLPCGSCHIYVEELEVPLCST